MNTYVSFELAKLLKEKGFDEPCSRSYKEAESPVLYVHQDKKYNNSFKKEWQNTVRKNSNMDNAVINRYSAPTTADVVMWIYKNYGIWLWVTMELGYRATFCWVFTGEHTSTNYKAGFKSPTEAFEAGIKYIIETI